MTAEREMTLEEWVARLPEFHLAHRQYTEMRENTDKLAAEIVRLRGEVESLTYRLDTANAYGEQCDADIRSLLPGVAPAEANAPAPAMPNGVEGLAYAQRLAVAIWSRNYREVSPQWEVCEDLMGVLSQIDNMVSGMSAADNRDAAGVCGTCNDVGMVGHYAPDGPFGEDCPACTPAAVPAGEAVAWIRDNLPESLHGMGVVDVLQLLLDGGIAAEKGLIDAESPQPADGGAVERWGQQFRCGCFLGFPTKGAIPKHCPQHMRDRQGAAWPLDTTPPAAQVQAAPQEGEVHKGADRCKHCGAFPGEPHYMAAHPSACELGAVREALEAAARSLRTIAEQAGKTEGLDDMMNVRGYANSRANVAELALQHRGDSRGGEG